MTATPNDVKPKPSLPEQIADDDLDPAAGGSYMSNPDGLAMIEPKTPPKIAKPGSRT